METGKMGTVAGRALGSLRQGQPGKQTGSNEMEICQRHKVQKLRIRRFSSAGLPEEVWVCTECDKEAVGMAENAAKVKAALAALDLNPRTERMTFDSFKPESKEQNAAKEKCISYAKMVSDNEPGGLVMLGGIGTGKTHLAISICKQVCQAGKTAKITSIPKMIRHIRSSWGGKDADAKSEDQIIRQYAEYGLLVIDEVGVQYGSDSEKISVSEVINERYNRMLPTVLIGNVKKGEAEEYLGKRVMDRVLDGGMIVTFDWESHRKMA